MVAAALIGADYRTVAVNGICYLIQSPTIYRLCGCIKQLAGMKQAETVKDVIESLGDLNKYAKALSWLVKGDESLADTFSQATPKDVVNALEIGLSLIDISVFQKAAVLAKYVAKVAATNTK